jgi:isopenicillin N synthase-like dioxygenase
MLSQDSIGGLEILNLNAQWIPAPPIEGTFVVNVGDWLQQASNGRFVSTVHQVKRSTGNKPRYSIPLFFGLDFDAYCEVRGGKKAESMKASKHC